jgi:hypothetical protein
MGGGEPTYDSVAVRRFVLALLAGALVGGGVFVAVATNDPTYLLGIVAALLSRLFTPAEPAPPPPGPDA